MSADTVDKPGGKSSAISPGWDTKANSAVPRRGKSPYSQPQMKDIRNRFLMFRCGGTWTTHWNLSATAERTTMTQPTFPPGWDAERIRTVLAHYEAQTEDEAVIEDEAAFDELAQTVIEVPHALMPVIRELLAKHGT